LAYMITSAVLMIKLIYHSTATTATFPLSLPDALPIFVDLRETGRPCQAHRIVGDGVRERRCGAGQTGMQGDEFQFFTLFLDRARSEEHTSELQSRENLVCRLLLEKKRRDDTTQSLKCH